MPTGKYFGVNYSSNGSHPTEELHHSRHLQSALIFALGFISSHPKAIIDLSFMIEGKEVAKHYLEQGRRLGKSKASFHRSATRQTKGGSNGKESRNTRRRLPLEKLGRVRM